MACKNHILPPEYKCTPYHYTENPIKNNEKIDFVATILYNKD